MTADYVEAAVQRLLSEDTSVSDQAIDVIIRDDVLLLRGEVESARRRDEIQRLVHTHFPQLRVNNDIVLTRANPPTEAEEL